MTDGIILVCLFGPESTGKSTLAKRLAEVFETEFVPEVSRELITSNQFTVEDIVLIGKAQIERIKTKLRKANKVLFCDSDLITTQIYSQHYLGVVPPVLHELEEEIVYDQYFLFDIDVPWVADGIRDLGERRVEMFEVFKSELEKRRIGYTLVQGTFEERQDVVEKEVTRLLRRGKPHSR